MMKRAFWLSVSERFWAALWPADLHRASHTERWISAVGGFLGVLAVLWFSSRVLDQQGAAMLIASMGATSVLLFAVPHGTLSQPWPVLGGHVISAFIGVTCAQQIGEPFVAAALAVGMAIAVMYYLRCLHPPGGATALAAVLGGEAVAQLGYGFVVTPVLINALIILITAALVNLPFSWRRYPARASQAANLKQDEPGAEKGLIAHEDLVYALSQLDSFIDVSEEDLIRIYTLAVHHPHQPVPCHARGEKCERDDRACLCRQMLEAQVTEPSQICSEGGIR
ncbi:MAG TPA: HPP family protein [Gammaproteobacteria bacterium]